MRVSGVQNLVTALGLSKRRTGGGPSLHDEVEHDDEVSHTRRKVMVDRTVTFSTVALRS